MLSSNHYLKSCHYLKIAGQDKKFAAGVRVARGMADLGFEEFYFLNDNKVISLLTGKTTTINATEAQQLFWVPEVEELMEELDKRHFLILSITNPNRRNFVIKIMNEKSNTSKRLEAKTLLQVFLEGLLFAINGDQALDALNEILHPQPKLVVGGYRV